MRSHYDALARCTSNLNSRIVFVFDRETGEPVWPIEERPVPIEGAAPGEKLSPTQPFPTVPAPFDRQGVSVDDLIDFTPELRTEALEIIEPYRIGPLFTPPTTRRTLTIPSRTGGGNWNGAAFDPETGVLYVPSQTKVDVYQVVPGDSLSGARYLRGGERAYRAGPRGLPLTKPPYGRVTAIGLNDGGEHLWMEPVGDGPIDHPALRGLELPRLGYPRFRFPIVTAGGLLFLSEGRSSGLESEWRTLDRSPDGDYLEPSVFRAFDKADGRLLWEYDLPRPASALPMTFRRDGVQFLVVAVGGLGTWAEELIAFHLPETGR